MDEPPADEAKTLLGCFLALAIGPIVAGGKAIAFSLLTGRSVGGPIVLESILVSVPFIAIALTGTLRKAPWLVGLALTLALWGYVLYEGVSHHWYPDGSGADIFGLALVELASTLLITAICLGVYWLQRRGTN
jgi:hypothetical protein